MLKAPEDLSKDDQQIYFAQLPKYFNPDTPISLGELFSGRRSQLTDALKVIHNPNGRHIIIYGERGVGKTSMVTVLPHFVKIGQKDILHALISCSSADTFDSSWKNMFSEITVENPDGGDEPVADAFGDKPLTPF